MSTERFPARDWRDEDLLQWLLDERLRDAVPRAELERDAARAATLRELEAFLGTCRAELGAEAAAADTAGLEARVLARTTREDLGWRGDLRLVRDYVRDGLRSSMLLRVVAASLLLHVIALPVVAYYAYFEPARERALEISLEPERPALPYVDAQPEARPEVALPELQADPGALPSHGVLFGRHVASLGLADLRGVSEAPLDMEVWGDDLGLVLWCEYQLDLLEARHESREPRLADFALEHLSDRLVAAPTGSDAPLARLERSTWLRAERLGATARLGQEFRLDATRLAGAAELRGEAWGEAFLAARAQRD